MQHKWLYAFLCIVLPTAWGLLMVGITRVLEKYQAARRAANPRGDDNARSADTSLAPDYYI